MRKPARRGRDERKKESTAKKEGRNGRSSITKEHELHAGSQFYKTCASEL